MTINNVACSQNNYSETEKTDALRLFDIQLLISKERKFDEALSLLEPILKNVPEDYGQMYSEQRRFWDEEEYIEYREVMKNTSIPFLLDAYSRVYYFLAIIHIERGNWEEAENYLLTGLKQIPSQPDLLCEMGMLYQSKFRATLAEANLNISSNYYSQAIESDLFCSSKLMARGYRGIGFNLIELGELESAETVFTLSLKYEDNPKAYDELEYIKKLRKGEITSPLIVGPSTNTQNIDITSYTYLYEQMHKLPGDLQEAATTNHYAYIFSKAALFLVKGVVQYREDDFFNYPLKEWDEKKLTSGCNQIVGYTKGLSPEYCFENLTEIEFENLLNLFHFDLIKTENTSGENIVKGYFKHKMDGYEIIMYCHILKD
jgi:tetratricopeptide (TPR) repeat protein